MQLPHLKTEIENAVSETCNMKAARVDDIQIELLKLEKEEANNVMHRLCVRICKTCSYQMIGLKSIFLLLPKKRDKNECNN